MTLALDAVRRPGAHRQESFIDEDVEDDLAAIAQDLPRAKTEIMNSAFQLCGILRDMIAVDVDDPMDELFGKNWQRADVRVAGGVWDYIEASNALPSVLNVRDCSRVVLRAVHSNRADHSGGLHG